MSADSSTTRVSAFEGLLGSLNIRDWRALLPDGFAPFERQVLVAAVAGPTNERGIWVVSRDQLC